jgi:hypothetical protein
VFWSLLIGGPIICVVVGFAAGSFWLVPVPFVVLWIWDATNGPSKPDNDSIFGALVLVVCTVGVIVGVLTRKLVRKARSHSSRENGSTVRG